MSALGDMIEQTGKRLTSIFITHGHYDHYYGLGQLVARFPDSPLGWLEHHVLLSQPERGPRQVDEALLVLE